MLTYVSMLKTGVSSYQEVQASELPEPAKQKLDALGNKDGMIMGGNAI